MTELRWKNYSKTSYLHIITVTSTVEVKPKLITKLDQQSMRTGNICCYKDGILIKTTEIKTSVHSN